MAQIAQVRYTATKLNAIKKEGILKPDSDGYYTLVIGGLNTLNSIGEYYTLQGAKELFDKSSIFQRRVATGNLKGELGHPKKDKDMTNDAYMSRILRTEETNVCAHISEVWLDENYGKNNPRFNNPQLVAIMGKVKPAGPKGFVLKEALDNVKENVCFSIRALTRDFYLKGVNHRVLMNIVSWDYVTEPGLNLANKWDSPALETISDMFITKRNIESVVNDKSPLAMESDKVVAREALELFKEPTVALIPSYSKW